MPFFKSATSLRSDCSDLDMDVLAESELARLQHQFRLLEGERHANTLETREAIRRQMLELKRLEKENEQLLRRRAVAENRGTLQREKDQANSLRALLGRRDDVEEEIMQEKKRLAQLDREIQSEDKRLTIQKKQVGCGHLIQKQKVQLLKRIQMMENQLGRASSQFDSQLVVNSELREEIEILQLRHDRFTQLSKRLEKALLDARGNIGAMVSSSSAAYDARDEAQNRMSQLQDKTQKDLRQYEGDLRELNRILAHDEQLDEFITIKLQERKLTEEALKAKEKQEQESKRRGPEEELLDSYEEALKKLLDLTGTSSLDAVLEKFAAEEERNFAQFYYVNEQNNQLEQLREQTAELRREIEMVEAQESQREAERLLRSRDVEAQQEEAVNSWKRAELLMKSQTKIWELLKSDIASLFGKLQCDTSPLEKELGGSTAERDKNVMIYLGSIEQKITELLAMYSYVKAEQQEKPYDTLETARLILGQKADVSSQRFGIQPPTTGPSHEAIAEEDQRPLTHTELREKVLKDIQSRPEPSFHKRNVQPDVAGPRDWASGYKNSQRVSLT